jgi:hypothetical protein
MWTVVVVGKELHEFEAAYGPYRSQAKARALVDLLVNPNAADFHDPEVYEVYAIPLQKYQDA